MGSVYHLMHNSLINHRLVNNVEAVIVNLGNHIVATHLLGDTHVKDSNNILILSITFTYTLLSKYTLYYQQFPFAPTYTTIFDSCKGLSLDEVSIDITYPVFLCGQLYFTLSYVCYHNDSCVLPPHGVIAQ